MDKIICPSCGELITEGPNCKSNGIITCDNCKEKISWKCDGEKTVAVLCK